MATFNLNAHLFEFDSVHGRYPNPVKLTDSQLDVGAGPIRLTSERDPEALYKLERDNEYTLRAWMAVVSYLLADWRFIYHQ